MKIIAYCIKNLSRFSPMKKYEILLCSCFFLLLGCTLKRESGDKYNEKMIVTNGALLEEEVPISTVSNWIEIGEVTALQWIDSDVGQHTMNAKTIYTYCWYKIVDDKKIYSISSKGRILTKNTYKTIKVGNALGGDLSEGYSIIDVSGYKYMHEYVNGRNKMVEFVSLP